jgi:hypothetical protein
MAYDLALCGKIVSFLGGATLSLDALTVRRRIKIEAGAQQLQAIFAKVGLENQLKDGRGRALNDNEVLQLWLAKRSLPWTQVGFILMTLGFLVDLFNP